MKYELHSYQLLLSDADNFGVFFRCAAENSEHAKEQAINAYPGAIVIYLKRLPMLLSGTTVWWKDPDNGLSSGRYQILKIITESGEIEDENNIVLLTNEAGSELEALAHELGPVPSIDELADDLLNSESDDGCDNGYTVVHKTRLLNLLNELRRMKN